MANQLIFKDKSFSVGDTLMVYQKVKEGDKERTQLFEGILIRVKGEGDNRSFTVRKIAAGGIGVEKIWPVASPTVLNIESKKSSPARRAKLYYLRGRIGKEALKIKERESNEKPAPRQKSRVTRKKVSSA